MSVEGEGEGVLILATRKGYFHKVGGGGTARRWELNSERMTEAQKKKERSPTMRVIAGGPYYLLEKKGKR